MQCPTIQSTYNWVKHDISRVVRKENDLLWPAIWGFLDAPTDQWRYSGESDDHHAHHNANSSGAAVPSKAKWNNQSCLLCMFWIHFTGYGKWLLSHKGVHGYNRPNENVSCSYAKSMYTCRRSLEMKREMPTYIGVGIVWLLCFLFLCLFHIFCDKSTLLSAACTLLWWALCTLWWAASTLLSAAYALLYVVCRGLCALWRMHFAACTLLWWALCCAQCSLWRMCATARAAQSGDTRRVANCSQSPPSYCSRLLQAATADS